MLICRLIQHIETPYKSLNQSRSFSLGRAELNSLESRFAMKPGLKNTLMRVTNLLLYLSFCGLGRHWSSV